MFHVKQNGDSQEITTDFDDLWRVESAPYHPDTLKQITTPWQLLEEERFNTLIASANDSRPTLSGCGMLTTDTVIHRGEAYTEDIEIEGLNKVSKGQLIIKVEGKHLEGASFLEEGLMFSFDASLALGPGCYLQSGATIDGTVSIGAMVEVRQGALLRGKILTGDRCIIGHASELKNVIMHDGAKAPHFAYVGDSILGANVNLGAGTKVSNLKITGTEIRIPFKETRLNTHTRKLGGILGDNVETGCNSVLNPGVIIGRDSGVYPCVPVSCGVYDVNSWIMSPTKIETRT